MEIISGLLRFLLRQFENALIEKVFLAAASAFVTKIIGPKEVWGGIPAKFIKMCHVHDGRKN